MCPSIHLEVSGLHNMCVCAREKSKACASARARGNQGRDVREWMSACGRVGVCMDIPARACLLEQCVEKSDAVDYERQAGLPC